MKYVLISDVHLSERPPSSCTETYLEDLFDLLGQVLTLAQLTGASAVVIAGDLFHHKAGMRTSHRLVQRVIRLFGKSPIPVLVVPGNHDMTHDRLDSIADTQPLGVLFESAAVELNGWGSCEELYGVPWQQRWDDESVWAALAGYRDSSHAGLVVAHAPLYPPGKELPYEFYPAEKFAEAMGGQGQVFYGHVHEPHGQWAIGNPPDDPNYVLFCNNGALSRGSLHEYNLTRDVYCTIWDSETGSFEALELAARPASEVFRLTEKQQVTDLAGRLDDFLAQIGAATLDVVSVEALSAHLATLDLEPAVLSLARELLEAVG